jgi:orotidine-5'-phosphate decarboxylase
VIKVGHELMTNVGVHAAVNLPKVFGKKVFADTKFYDIPNTVKRAAAAITCHGVDYFNVMCEGGRDMMAAAIEGSREQALAWGIPRPQVIAVTIPTSQVYRDLRKKGMCDCVNHAKLTITEEQKFVERIVFLLAKEAFAAGVDCVLCSPLEAPLLQERWPNKEILTPGIKYLGDAPDDQKRVLSPYEARYQGITNLVIGRLISSPPAGMTPKTMVERIRMDIARAELQLRAAH